MLAEEVVLEAAAALPAPFLTRHAIRPVVDRSFPFEPAPEAPRLPAPP